MVCENIIAENNLANIVDCIGSAGFSNNDTLFLLMAFLGFILIMFAFRIPLRFAFGVSLIVCLLFIPFSQDVFGTIFVAALLLIGYFVTRGIASGFKDT
jgi:hypothetical protein